jgi:hypothetical protein
MSLSRIVVSAGALAALLAPAAAQAGTATADTQCEKYGCSDILSFADTRAEPNDVTASLEGAG